MGFWDGVGANVRADGDVRYRVDGSGRRIGVLPACAYPVCDRLIIVSMVMRR